MASLKERLTEILIRRNIISKDDLDRALEKQKESGGSLGKILVELKMIDEDELSMVLSEGLGMLPIDVSRLKVDPAVLELIPENIARKYHILPISKLGNTLTLAMSDPLNIFTIDNVKVLTGLEITPIVGKPKAIQEAVAKYYGAKEEETFAEIIKDIRPSSGGFGDSGDDLELVKESGGNVRQDEIESLTQEAPIIKLTNTIIQQAVAAKASDVFIEPLEKTLRIRYRIDGLLREIDTMTKVLHFPLVSRIKVISNLDISEHRLPQDGRFKMVYGDDNKQVDFRVSVLPTALGEKVVLRVLDRNLERIDVDKLGFEAPSLARLKECAERPHGLILACGPTGSGKTTTLYSILKLVDTPGKNLVTVEDPVEYQMKGLNQVNIRTEVGLSFTASLRSILRQDPDVIMIGEIRDSETLDIAVKAALTGHLVLSSLHTTTAAGSVVRMVNMGVEPFLICSSVICIVAQRLLRRVCEACRQEYEISDTVYTKMGIARIMPDKDRKFFKPIGCDKCFKTGYKGRIGITEILVLTPKVKDAILRRSGEINIKAIGRREGMITMREDGLIKASRGLTTLEEVVRVTAPDEEIK